MFGSLGAGRMNELMLDFIDRMGQNADFRLIYATGKRYYDEVRSVLNDAGLRSPRIDVREYIYDMPKVMSAADLILCRAGASTIGELTYLGKPAIIVPSPNVANNHQEKNARVLHDAGAARMLLESELTGEKLFDAVTALLEDPAALESMHRASAAMGFRDATDRITGIVLGLAQEHAENPTA